MNDFILYILVFQSLRPSIRQVWHHGGGLPGQLHVSGADHLQLQSAELNLERQETNFSALTPLTDCVVLNGFIVDSDRADLRA